MAALIRPHTSHSNYELEGEVPETRMTGHTAEISNICEYEWYKWVMFRYGPTSYPESHITFGRYLGPSIGVGSAMTYKILKSNGNYVCRTSVFHLNQEELASE